MHKNSLIYNILVNFIFVKLPTYLFLPVIRTIFYFSKVKFINKQLDKRNGTLELIESTISTYDQLIIERNNKKLVLLNSHKKFNKILKLFLAKDKLQLYLLRNLLYRILNKCLTQSNIRELVKMEILKAPERTFSEFIDLYSELRGELNSLIK